MVELKELYERRFSAGDRERKLRAWSVIYDVQISKWVRATDTVLDLGAGYCELINAVAARRRIAVDLNVDTVRFAAPGVEVRNEPAGDLAFLRDGEVDVVLSSNFLEHLPDKAAVAETMRAAFRVLRRGGLVVLIGPNVRIVPGTYWDFFDHHVALSDRSVAELLATTGFEPIHVEPRFVPYTVVRWRLPSPPWLIRAYLALRPLSSAIFGQQFLVVARKP